MVSFRLFFCVCSPKKCQNFYKYWSQSRMQQFPKLRLKTCKVLQDQHTKLHLRSKEKKMYCRSGCGQILANCEDPRKLASYEITCKLTAIGRGKTTAIDFRPGWVPYVHGLSLFFFNLVSIWFGSHITCALSSVFRLYVSEVWTHTIGESGRSAYSSLEEQSQH